MRRISAVLGFAVAVGIVGVRPAASCPGCGGFSGTTLSQEVAAASLIIYGTPKNARLDPREQTQGATDIDIEVVIKPNEILGDKKVITLSKYLPTDPKQPTKYLIFCDVYKGQLDPYRGMPFKAGSKIADYLKGAIGLKDKPIAARLEYFFHYLDSEDLEIANDAFTEFANADYKDVQHVAKNFPAERIQKWIKEPGTPPSRLGLYGLLLGHCGKLEDANVLREIIDDPKRRFAGGLEGVYGGLTLLAPKDGWETVASTLTDAKKDKDFLLRYAALRTARFFWDYRSDVVDKATLAKTVASALDQADMADLVIEDLRKWQCWQYADQILSLLKTESHDIPLIRRAVLRFMLRCPEKGHPGAAEYVAKWRAKDPKWVEEVESLLTAESIPPTAPAGK